MKKLLVVFAVMMFAVCSYAAEKDTHNGIGGLSPVKLSLFPPIEIPPSMVTNTVAGIDLGIFASRTANNYGLHYSPFSTRSSVLYGLQGGIYSRSYEMYGWQGGWVTLSREKAHGLQTGLLVAEAGELIGVQLGGLFAKNDKGTGFQFGAFTYSEEFSGLQLGVFNYAKVMNTGVQIGVINIISNGAIKCLPLFNAKF